MLRANVNTISISIDLHVVKACDVTILSINEAHARLNAQNVDVIAIVRDRVHSVHTTACIDVKDSPLFQRLY